MVTIILNMICFSTFFVILMRPIETVHAMIQSSTFFALYGSQTLCSIDPSRISNGFYCKNGGVSPLNKILLFFFAVNSENYLLFCNYFFYVWSAVKAFLKSWH